MGTNLLLQNWIILISLLDAQVAWSVVKALHGKYLIRTYLDFPRTT